MTAAASTLVNTGLAIGLAALTLLVFDLSDRAAAALPAAADTTDRPSEDATVHELDQLHHYPITGDPEVVTRGAAALAEITYPWWDRLPGWQITFHAAEEGAYGYTLTREHRIDIYVRRDQPQELLVHVLAHEIGHAVDVTFNDGHDRTRWQQLRGIEDAPWWPDNRAADFATGAGDFAESFAAWQVGPASFRSQLGAPPNAAERALLAELAELSLS